MKGLRTCASCLGLLFLFWSVGAPKQVRAGISLPAGYHQGTLLSVPSSAYLGGIDYLSGGDLVYFDGEEVKRLTGSGPISLFDPPGTVWGAFVKVVGGDTIYFGESAESKIYSVSPSGGGSEVAQVQFNFDMENFGSELYVAYNASSSPPPGEPDAAVARLTLPGGTLDVIIGDTDGYSGPLTFDPDGNLYYCDPSPDFGVPGVNGLYFFTREQVTSAFGSGELTLADGEDLGDDLDGCYDMEYDPQVGRIFVSTGNDFDNQIQVYDVGSGTVSPFATKTSGHFWSTYLRFRSGTKAFLPDNGPGAGVLTVVQNGTVYEIRPNEGGGSSGWTGTPAAAAAGLDRAGYEDSRVANVFLFLLLPVCAGLAARRVLVRGRRGGRD